MLVFPAGVATDVGNTSRNKVALGPIQTHPVLEVSQVKVFISADMEGATGITASKHTASDSPEYGRMRKLLTQDVNAAIEGACEAGATEVLVNDSHGSMINILIEELDSRARLISGSTKQLAQSQGVDSSFDAAFFVAYHAMEGTQDAVINHTLLGRTVSRVLLNGQLVGETGLNAAIAAHFGVPVVLVTGDDKVSAEARARLGDIETVCVKQGLDRFVANCLPPAQTKKMIKEGAARAMRRAKEIKPVVMSKPVTFEVEFKTTAETTLATLFPEVKLIGPKTISLTGDDMISAFKMFWGALILGRAGAGGVL
jgi:D-amino peptidase